MYFALNSYNLDQLFQALNSLMQPVATLLDRRHLDAYFSNFSIQMNYFKIIERHSLI